MKEPGNWIFQGALDIRKPWKGSCAVPVVDTSDKDLPWGAAHSLKGAQDALRGRLEHKQHPRWFYIRLHHSFGRDSPNCKCRHSIFSTKMHFMFKYICILVMDQSTPPLHSANVDNQESTLVKSTERNTFNGPITINMETVTNTEKVPETPKFHNVWK